MSYIILVNREISYHSIANSADFAKNESSFNRYSYFPLSNLGIKGIESSLDGAMILSITIEKDLNIPNQYIEDMFNCPRYLAPGRFF